MRTSPVAGGAGLPVGCPVAAASRGGAVSSGGAVRASSSRRSSSTCSATRAPIRSSTAGAAPSSRGVIRPRCRSSTRGAGCTGMLPSTGTPQWCSMAWRCLASCRGERTRFSTTPPMVTRGSKVCSPCTMAAMLRFIPAASTASTTGAARATARAALESPPANSMPSCRPRLPSMMFNPPDAAWAAKISRQASSPKR